jgi:PadR family transcriptional regulator, regulatory protein PadR
MKADALRGHMDGIVLAVLNRGPLHGYGIIEALLVSSNGRLDVPAGTVYPALHRLERSGLISSSWQEASPRNRRVYALTPAGRRALDHERTRWQEFADVITTVLTETP